MCREMDVLSEGECESQDDCMCVSVYGERKE